MTGDLALEIPVTRAIDYTIRTQHRGSGGWRYHVADPGDTSQLGWQVMALRSAERAGIDVPHVTWRGVQHFLESVSSGSRRGLAAYRPTDRPQRTMTAEAAYCRYLVAFRSPAKITPTAIHSSADEASSFLMAELPGDGQPNFYYWYYATLFLHDRGVACTANRQMLAGERRSGETPQSDWLRWNDALKRTLVNMQQTGGEEAGSWPPDTVWGGYGGRVYTTALATLCLEVYYRYAVEEERVVAAPPAAWTNRR
jgi:hypothetical protein